MSFESAPQPLTNVSEQFEYLAHKLVPVCWSVGTGVSQWESTCSCTVWGQTRQYSPLALAQHHQNRRLVKLLEEFQRDGSAASTSAAVVTAMQRMLLCYLCEEYELLDYDATVELADALPPAPFSTLMRFGK